MLISKPMKKKNSTVLTLAIVLAITLLTLTAFAFIRSLPQEDLKGKYAYKEFEIGKKMPVLPSRASMNSGRRP